MYVSFSQIFVGKFELWKEPWGDWGYWRNGGIRFGVDGVGNKGLVTGNMEVKHNMSFAYSLCMGDSTGSLGRSYLILSPTFLWVSKFDLKLESLDLIFKTHMGKCVFEKSC